MHPFISYNKGNSLKICHLSKSFKANVWQVQSQACQIFVWQLILWLAFLIDAISGDKSGWQAKTEKWGRWEFATHKFPHEPLHTKYRLRITPANCRLFLPAIRIKSHIYAIISLCTWNSAILIYNVQWRQTDRQTDKQTDRQTDRLTDWLTDWQTDRQTDR